jgi:hypothetical protein
METGEKNKRPQALPRAKESVMIPTLLMNIPEPQTTKVNICCGSGIFFPSESRFFFILFVIAAWKKAEETGEHTTIEDRGGKTWKEGRMPGGTETHPRCVWQLLALSRLVRSSLSFLPSCEEGGRQNAIDDSVTGSLSRLERES